MSSRLSELFRSAEWLVQAEDKTMKNGETTFVYVDHLLAEHRRLDGLIRRTLATFPKWEEADSTAWLPRLLVGLESIRDELAHHFREEEQGGCLEEAVAHCPALSAEVQQIEGEHQLLLGEIDGLIHRCRSATPQNFAEMQAIETEMRRLVRQLRSHEARENAVLQRGFGVCLDGEDMANGRSQVPR
ncbi:MAG: hemerythrin domain-containing protein [Pirellulaceae bacterium]|nr:hemerythrin domain-containing protein [Pirellulaceae bacterium]